MPPKAFQPRSRNIESPRYTTTSVRLDEQEDRILGKLVHRLGVTKSDVIRKAIARLAKAQRIV